MGLFQVLILGGGPAGAVLAQRLAALGWTVALVGAPRPRAWEGIAPRVLEALRRSGCSEGTAVAGTEARRSARWNGRATEHNVEYLVDRAAFDRALRADAASAGVHVVEASVARVARDGTAWLACDAAGTVLARGAFLVEARGRRAPAAGRSVAAGPRTVAVARSFSGPAPATPATALASFPDGWAWMAALPCGRRVVQFVLAADSVPRRGGLTPLHERLVASVPEAAAWTAATAPLDAASARDATARLRGSLVAPDYLRIGDAACAIDPLSGLGMFEAVGGAFAATAAVHTLLADPASLACVRRFVEDRTLATFRHAAALGQAFYQAEARWPGHPFWHERAAWPAGGVEPPASHGVRRQPVVIGNRIEMREVLVTPRHPRGVLAVGGVELVPFLRGLRRSGGAVPPEGAGPEATALAWLKSNRFLTEENATTE